MPYDNDRNQAICFEIIYNIYLFLAYAYNDISLYDPLTYVTTGLLFIRGSRRTAKLTRELRID